MLQPQRRTVATLFLLAFALGASPAGELQAFLSDARGFAGLHSFRLHVVSVSPGGTTTRDMTFVAPDKLRVEIAATGLVVVVIGTNVWLRDPQKKWTKGKLSTGDPFAPAHEIYRIVALSKSGTVHFAGPRDLDGAATHLYELALPSQKGYAAEATSVWIGVADGYPHRVDERSGRFTTTATYSAWNQALTVSAQ